MNKAQCLGSVQCRGKYHSKRADAVIRQLAQKTGIIVEWHVLRALEEQGFDMDPDRDNKSLYDPDKLYSALGKYGKPPELSYDGNCWHAAWQETLKVFGGENTLKPVRDKEELRNAVKLEKASGAPLFVKKEQAFDSDYSRMCRFADGSIAAQPCVAYHRIQHGVEGPKTRLVWGYPLQMTLCEAQYARPLIDWFLASRTPMAFGLHRHELAARIVPVENSGVRYGFDFSAFDSSIHPKIIAKAFDVLKTHFAEVNELEWERMVHYFIHTPIIMPDGEVYVVHQGVPSGSYWTQMVDSIVNYFAVQYATLRLTGSKVFNDKLLVLGDDGLLGLGDYVPLVRWASVFREVGLNLNAAKSEVTRGNEGVTFLGHTWERGLVNRALDDIAKRMAFPERPVNIEDARLRIVTRVLAFGSDALNAHLIIQRWSRYKGPCVSSIYYRDVLTEPVLGWREFCAGDRPSSSFPRGALSQAYMGILT